MPATLSGAGASASSGGCSERQGPTWPRTCPETGHPQLLCNPFQRLTRYPPQPALLQPQTVTSRPIAARPDNASVPVIPTGSLEARRGRAKAFRAPPPRRGCLLLGGRRPRGARAVFLDQEKLHLRAGTVKKQLAGGASREERQE